MRLFWAFVLLLLLAGGAAAFMGGRTSLPQPLPVTPREPAGPQVATDSMQPLTVNNLPAAASQPSATGKVEGTPTQTESVIDPASVNDILSKAAAGIGAGGEATIDTTGGEPVSLPLREPYTPQTVSPSNAVRVGKDLVIDGVYRVSGSGTKADPYVVPFDLLLSARNTYNPRKGLTRLPHSVAFLHNAHVKITGYTAFPMAATDPRELLVMFNAWDGCCIGVPPSEYDAVETRLAQAAEGNDRFTSYATITGIFKVDPYIDNGWLLGLYLMEDATMTDGRIDAQPSGGNPDDDAR